MQAQQPKPTRDDYCFMVQSAASREDLSHWEAGFIASLRMQCCEGMRILSDAQLERLLLILER